MRMYRLAWAIVLPVIGPWMVPLLVLGMATVAQEGEAATEAGFSVDKIAVFDNNSLIVSYTTAKIYLIDNKNHLIQHHFEF